MPRARVWSFTLVYNEAALIAYWIRHYRSFCERVVVYIDDESSDGTFDIARREGADVRTYHGIGLDDIAFSDFASDAYKEAVGQADWIIWSDGDELLYHSNISDRLNVLHQHGVTMPHVDYYVMASEGLPCHAGQIYDADNFRRGLFVQADAKVTIFNPNAVHVQWSPGKHHAHIVGDIVRDDDDMPLKLLHYRWLGEDYLRARDAQNYARLSQRALHGGYGTHVYPDFIGPYHPMWSGPRPGDAIEILS